MVETEFADDEDCSEIWDMLLKTFNPMCDRIPLQTELSKLIANKSVLKVSINNEIAGVLLFQDSKSKSYVRCLCVREEYQNSVIGYSLMAKYFNLHLDSGIKLIYLWVDSENESVRKLHDRFGFKEDGTRNYIFRREVKR